MFGKFLSLGASLLLVFSLAAPVSADEISGTISKVGDGGRDITVKAKDKEVTVKISGSRTKLDGVGDRAELKAGQNVTVDYSGDEAKKITVKKGK